MPKTSFFPVGAINIAMHSPHSVDQYVALFKKMYQLKRIIPIRATTGVMIGNLTSRVKDKPEEGLSGEFYHFLFLEPGEPWFDVDRKDQASEEERLAIKIPDNLKPHLARFSFIFFPKGHRLYVQLKTENRSFGIKNVAKMLSILVKDESLGTFPHIEINTEPDSEVLEQILKMPYLRHLQIDLVRPNPDDHEEAGRKMLERLERQNAKKIVVRLDAVSGGALIPDAKTKTLAKIAASNGHVSGAGLDASLIPVNYSTKETPYIEQATYDPDVQTMNDALYYLAMQMHASITN